MGRRTWVLVFIALVGGALAVCGPGSWSAIGVGVGASVLAAVFFELTGLALLAIDRKILQRAARAFWGDRFVEDAPFVIYAEFELRPEILVDRQDARFPYRKPDEHHYALKTERPAPTCDLRGISYLVSTLSKIVENPVRVQADTNLRHKLDLDMVSLGLWSNLKTRDCFENPGQRMVRGRFAVAELLRASDNQPFIIPEHGYDYGVIVKIHPTQFPTRTWFACAGLAEWGTSAAAWYLSRHWTDIYRQVKKRAFTAVVRVRPCKDESVELLLLEAHDGE